MTPASRNLWLEIVAFGLVLISLFLFVVAGYFTAMFMINGLLPNSVPLEIRGVVLGRREALVSALSTSLPGAVLVATAWALRLLLVAEKRCGA